jgi:hypothetical protein
MLSPWRSKTTLYISILSFFVDDLLQLYEISVSPFGCKPTILHPPSLAIVLRSIRDEEAKAYRLRTDGSLRDILPTLQAILKPD